MRTDKARACDLICLGRRLQCSTELVRVGWFVDNRVAGMEGGRVRELARKICHENHWALGKALANLSKPLSQWDFLLEERKRLLWSGRKFWDRGLIRRWAHYRCWHRCSWKRSWKGSGAESWERCGHEYRQCVGSGVDLGEGCEVGSGVGRKVRKGFGRLGVLQSGSLLKLLNWRLTHWDWGWL